ncbi:MAG: hypothetical protein C0404_01145 [Verrucomicrobia bacterium]|nr:hypothetical protein [Verrucomicrobiota bacterium]
MAKNELLQGRWLRHLSNDDPLLLSAFAACRLFVLLSEKETQPISVLQAMACNKPILLADAAYTIHSPFDAATTVQLTPLSALDTSIMKAWDSGLALSLSMEFTWPFVAKQLVDIYESIIGSLR